MKSFILVFIGSLLSVWNCHAQFEWLSPLPTGNNLMSGCFFNADSGIFAGEGGDILMTLDGGVNWERYHFDNYPEWGYDFSSMIFIDENTGFVTGSSGAIFKTTDGGQSWIEKYGCQNCEDFLDIFFIDPQRGWAAGMYGALRRTTDGGETWTSISGFPLDQNDLYAIWFTDEQNGWAAAGENVVKLSYGGDVWEFYSYDFALYDVFFIDEDVGWMCGSGGMVIYTSDGGSSWNLVQALENGILRDIWFEDETFGWAVGDEGTIIHSEDGGLTWNQIVPVTDFSLQCFIPAGDGVFYVGGQGGTVLKSENGGDLWIFPQDNTIRDDIADIAFSDPNTGWTVTYNGKIFKSQDGGMHWNLSFSDPLMQFSSLTAPDPDHVWAAGTYANYGQGAIVGTENGGLDWTFLADDIPAIHDITGTDALHGWAVGMNGAIYHTQNGGNNWFPQNSGADNNLNSVFFLDNQNGLAGGYDEVVQTYNGGETWEMQEVFMADFWLLTNVYAFNTVNRFAAGAMYLYYAEYEGNTWSQGSQNITGVYDVAYYTPQFLWEAGDNGLLLKRSTAWEYYSITSNDLNALYFDEETATGYVAGDFGTIIKIDLDYWTGEYEAFPEDKNCRVKLSPNPAANMVDCRFSLVDGRLVTIRIFDVEGRERMTVTDKYFTRGDYLVQFDVSCLEPGIYFYRVMTGEEVSSGKLIVAR